MANHLEHGAADTQGINGPNAHEHKAHVAHGAAGDPSFDVVLGEGVERPVDDVDDSQHDQGRRQDEMDLREHLHVEAQQGIAAHLQQHPSQQHRHRCIRLPVGIGKPGVQGEDRQLDAKANQETQVTEQAKGAPRRAGGEVGEVEADGVTREGQGQSAQQDQQGGCGRVKDELGGRVLPLLAAPDGNQQIDRHQLQFPGEEEQQEILGEKDQALG